jgi:hypothetical protein
MRKLIFSLVSLFLICLGILIVVLNNSSPTDGVLPKAGFFIFFVLTLWCLLMICVLVFSLIRRSKLGRQQIKALLRRVLIITIAISGIILFSSLKVLNILSALTFIISLGLLELFFVTKKIERRNEI